MVFGVQKVGFCIAKVWFLFFKRVFFVLQYIIPCPRTPTKWYCDFPPLVLQCRYFYLLYPTFRHVHPVGVGADLSCPHPRNTTKWRCDFPPLVLQCRYFYLLYPTFCHVHPVGVGADLSCPYPRNSPKWCCVFPSLVLQYIIPHPRNTHQMALRFSTVDIAIHHTAPP